MNINRWKGIVETAFAYSIVALAAIPLQTVAQSDLTIPFHELTVAESSNRIRSGEIQAIELVERLLDRIDEYESLNAFISVDREGALTAARAVDKARQRGLELGPLAGVPLVVKDNIDTRNLPTTGGTRALERFRPASDAPVVQRLSAAGAIILGKTNLHELAIGVTSANAYFGRVANAYSADRFAGGSSGGTAAAVAARLAPGGLGTDTGGSVRVPAALNGIAGLRPTIGRYPQSGIIPLSGTRDTAGPMARTVEDLAVLDSVITGYDQAIEPYDLKSLRLGVPKSQFWADLEPETRALAEALLEKLRRRGASLVEVELDGLDEHSRTLGAMSSYEIRRDLSRYLDDSDTGIGLRSLAEKVASPDVKAILETRILGEAAASAEAYRASMEVGRPALQAAYRAVFACNELDALIFPTTVRPAGLFSETDEIEHNGKTASTFSTYVRNTAPAAFAGLPGLSIPIGLSGSGLPIGIELDGPPFSDRRLLAIGLAMERVLGPLPAPE